MANSLTALLPTLIAERAINYLARNSQVIKRVHHIEAIQENYLRGKSEYNGGAVILNFDNKKEIKIKSELLESKISQGNFDRVMERNIDPQLEDLLIQFDASVSRLISDLNASNVIIGFLEFEPASTYSANAPVDESIITDPESNISLRTQKYYDASLRTWYYQIDCTWAIAALIT